VLIKVKDAIIGLFVVVSFGAFIVLVYHFEKERGYRDLAKRIVGLSPRGKSPETIDDLKRAIALYENQIELNVKIGAQTGVYWKILAIRLADKGMHKDALEAFDRALYYNADDPTIFYLTGESASVAAASTLPFNDNSVREKERYQRLAESAYLRAIDPTYAKPRLGLGILYTFDMNRPADALPHLEKYMQIGPNDIGGMFVTARAYYMTENFERSIDLYNRILSRTKDPKVKTEAQNNIDVMAERGLLDLIVSCLPDLSYREKITLCESLSEESDLFQKSGVEALIGRALNARDIDSSRQTAQRAAEKARARGINMVCWQSPLYPPLLREIYDP